MDTNINYVGFDTKNKKNINNWFNCCPGLKIELSMQNHIKAFIIYMSSIFSRLIGYI